MLHESPCRYFSPYILYMNPAIVASTDGRLSCRRMIYLRVSRWRVKEVFSAGLSVSYPVVTVVWSVGISPSYTVIHHLVSSHLPRKICLNFQKFYFASKATIDRVRMSWFLDYNVSSVKRETLHSLVFSREYQWSIGWLRNAGTGLVHNDLYQVLWKPDIILRGDSLGNVLLLVFTNLFILVTVNPEPIPH